MKILTVLGTRPEIIRLSRIIGNLESQGVFALSPNNFQDRFVTAGLSESN